MYNSHSVSDDFSNIEDQLTKHSDTMSQASITTYQTTGQYKNQISNMKVPPQSTSQQVFSSLSQQQYQNPLNTNSQYNNIQLQQNSASVQQSQVLQHMQQLQQQQLLQQQHSVVHTQQNTKYFEIERLRNLMNKLKQKYQANQMDQQLFQLHYAQVKQMYLEALEECVV